MKKIISLVAITLLIVQFSNCKKDDKILHSNDGIINFLTGNANIVLDGKTMKANVGDKVTQGMAINTEAKSVVDISFENSVIRISENSSVVIQELAKNLSDNKEFTELYVNKGKMFAQVTKKLTGNEKFKINTQTAVAAVRGTEFLVSVENSKTQISCIEGKVAVRDSQGKDSSFMNIENGKSATIETGKPILVDELTEENIKDIIKMKPGINTAEEQKNVKKIGIKEQDNNVVEKDATKLQADEIKSYVQDTSKSELGVKNFIDDIKSENRAFMKNQKI